MNLPRTRRNELLAAAVILAAALGFRLFIAVRLPTDEPDDGRVYAAFARNILEHGRYSLESEEPFSPTLIRVPGYPVFLAAVYRVFGVNNNTAVRVVQAVVDTFSCLIVAALAFTWTPAQWDSGRRHRAFLVALALMAACPFIAIFCGTILSEIGSVFLIAICLLAASQAIKSVRPVVASALWLVSGIAGGVATMFRPDSALFIGAAGVTLVIVGARDLIREGLRASVMTRIALHGLLLCAGFAAALAPWTIRNERVFGVFQPISPPQANMPDEFVPRGYIAWLKTWVDDVRYTEKFEWSLDQSQIAASDLPESAFDSADERDRVTQLLDLYNHPAGADQAPTQKPEQETNQQEPDQQKPGQQEANQEEQSQQEESEKKDDSDEKEEADEKEEEDEPPETPNPGEMTPEVDRGFAELAQQRIARHPIRCYVVMPIRRGLSMWFDTHSHYYPFQGELFPLQDLDHDIGQHIWLPVFGILSCLYTALALLGTWVICRSAGGWRWMLLLVLAIFPRLAYLSTMENPEPRYFVEFFILLSAVGALGLFLKRK